MIKVAICDDEDEIISLIENMLLKESEINHIAIDIDSFYSGGALEKSILNGAQYDLLYLDIHMEGESGITAAQNIRKVDENLLIIYVSSYDKYWMELFRLDVFEFIKKPIHQDIFVRTFFAAYQRICSRKVYFSFHYKNELHKVLCDEIIYFESNGRQIRMFMKNGEIEVFNNKLNEIEKQLQTGKIPFLRIHQSFLVNYHWIKAHTKVKVTMINGQQLPISVERQKDFIQHYGRLLGGEIIG